MIVDSHVHMDARDQSELEADAERLLAAMERMGIEKCCLMPRAHGLWSSREDNVLWAEQLCRLTARYPGRFFPMLWINPNLPLTFLKDLAAKYVLDGPVVGIKVKQHAPDSEMHALFDFLQKHDIPVLMHSWYHTGGTPKPQLDPSRIVNLVRDKPALRLLMAHLTGCRFRGVQDMKPYKNISIDTSGAQPYDGYVAYAVRELGAERVYFGSDFPLRDFPTQVARVDSAEIAPRERGLVLGDNALSFFRRG